MKRTQIQIYLQTSIEHSQRLRVRWDGIRMLHCDRVEPSEVLIMLFKFGRTADAK